MQKSNRKILVFYASCGEGHKIVASALKEKLKVSCYDILDFCPYFFKLFYSSGYRLLVRYFPSLWKIIFQLSKKDIFKKGLFLWHCLIFKRFFSFILKEIPFMVISTHFFIPPLITRLQKKIKIKNIVVVTDFGVHPLWGEGDVDIYFVATSFTKNNLINLGIDEEKIIVSGIPLREGFSRDINEEELRKKLHVEKEKVLLFFSSNIGNIPFIERVVPLLDEEFDIFVIYGKNKKLRKTLRKFSSLKLFSYYKNIWEIMRLSLAIITKPGGVTISEAIYLKKPLIFTHLIGGQEEENYYLLKRWGVAFKVRNGRELMEKIEYIKNNYPQILTKFPPSQNALEVIEEKLEKLLCNNDC